MEGRWPNAIGRKWMRDHFRHLPQATMWTKVSLQGTWQIPCRIADYICSIWVSMYYLVKEPCKKGSLIFSVHHFYWDYLGQKWENDIVQFELQIQIGRYWFPLSQFPLCGCECAWNLWPLTCTLTSVRGPAFSLVLVSVWVRSNKLRARWINPCRLVFICSALGFINSPGWTWTCG